MRPAEVLRAALKIIAAGGWSHEVDARDADGQPVPLWDVGSSESGRAEPTRQGVSYSIYGAIVKAIWEAHGAGERVERQALVFDVIWRCAAELVDAPLNGHPLIQYERREGRTQGEVLAFLERCAAECDRIGSGPFEPPTGVKPEVLAALDLQP